MVMKPSVEHYCNNMARSGLLKPDQVRELRQRWLHSAGAHAADVEKFLAWIPLTGVLTEHQVAVLVRGHADQLFLGPYTIQERVGKGQMAGVYKAVHATGWTVAIKVLPPSKAKDPQVLARFQREAQLALRLTHPNVVRTFQTGVANGLHYLVMEYLEGETLDKVLQRRGRLPCGEAVRLAHQTLLGLQGLHEQGLIHRDIKPSNLMLVGGRPDSTLEATVKILDIGTGRALFDSGPGTELTNESDLLGTPEYMAPEQARDPRSADIRADIYSAGCVLYHALAGRPPFTDANRVRLLVRVATEEPRPVRDFNQTVPDGLQQILNWMLAKDPSRRYPTPERAAASLQMFLAAGAEVVSLERDPRVRPYLNWLASQAGQAGGAVPVAAPVAPRAPVAPVAPVAPTVPVARPVARPPAAVDDLVNVEPVIEVEAIIEVEAEYVEDDSVPPARKRPSSGSSGVKRRPPGGSKRSRRRDEEDD
jgi:serine/threonine protein kinase